jgi:HEAT repeat protein
MEGVAGALLSASSWPGHEGHPRLLLDEIVHRALSPGARSRREALERALLAELSRRSALEDVVFLLRELALVGAGASVPALERLLAGAVEPVRSWALRALAANPSAESGAALEAALGAAEGEEARTALAGALRAHRRLAALGRG